MSSKETNLKEKFRIALNSTAKVISEDFYINNKNTEDKKTKDLVSIEIDNLTNPSDFIRLRAETDSSALKKKFSINDVLTDDMLIGSTFHSNINNYFNSFLIVSFGDVINKLNFLGLENKNDMFIFYLEVENLPNLNTISIDNKLLFDLYPEQQNIVHIKKNGNKKSFISRFNNSILSVDI